MKFFMINTLGESSDDQAVIDSPPEGLDLASYRPAKGEPTRDVYPDNARIVLSKKNAGPQLDSLLGNTQRYLIVERAVKEVIEEHCNGIEIEYLPFTLYSPKNRVQSKAYFIVNPIGAVDCLNPDASVIVRLNKPGDPYHGAVMNIKKFVLDPAKLKSAPALFRVKEKPNHYVINERLADAFRDAAFTNMILTEVPQQEATGRR